MMAAEPVMVPVFVVGLAQLPASILALPDIRERRAPRSANSRHGPITDEYPRTPPLVDASSSTPLSPVRGRGVPHRAAAARATGTEPHPNKNRVVAPRVALGRLSRRRLRRTWGDESTQAHASLQRPATSLRHREEL